MGPSVLATAVAAALGITAVVVVAHAARHVLLRAFPAGAPPRPAPAPRDAAAPSVQRRPVRPAAPPSVAPAPFVAEPSIVETLALALCEPAAERLCTARERCGCVHPEPQCRDDAYAACTRWIVLELDASTSPIELDGPGIAQCLADLERLGDSCNVDDRVDCGWLVRAPVEIDGVCPPDARHCRGGVCDHTGMCRAASRDGEPMGRACGPGLAEVNRSEGRGYRVLCLRPARHGERCADRTCADGLRCREGRCGGMARRGERCDVEWECEHGLTCDGGRCAASPLWCDGDDHCGVGLACVGAVETRCVPRRRRRRRACGDGRVCAATETCIEERVGRCEASLCDVEILTARMGGVPGEPIPTVAP